MRKYKKFRNKVYQELIMFFIVIFVYVIYLVYCDGLIDVVYCSFKLFELIVILEIYMYILYIQLIC